MKLSKRSCISVFALSWFLAFACAPAVLAGDSSQSISGLPLPTWQTDLPNANDGFLQALQAVTGDPPKDDLRKLLSGVIKVSRIGDGIELQREDGAVMRVDGSNEMGQHLLAKIDNAVSKARKKFGEPVGDLIDGFTSVTLTGNHVTIERAGTTVLAIEGKQKQDQKYRVKEIKLEDLSFELSEHAGHSTIKNVSGVTVVLDTLGIPITFREFERWQNKDGENVYCVGIKNPLPHQIAGLLGGEVLHLKFTESGKKNHQVTTNDIELMDAENAEDNNPAVANPAGSVNSAGTAPGGSVNPVGSANPPGGSVNPAGTVPGGSVNPLGTANPPAGSVAPLGTANPPAGSVAPLGTANPPAGSVAPPGTANPPGGSVNPLGTANPPAGSVNPLGTANPPGGSVNPLGTANPPAGSVNPLGTANPPGGSVNPLGTANPPAGSVAPPGTANPPADSVNPEGTANPPGGSVNPEGTANPPGGSVNPAGTANPPGGSVNRPSSATPP